MFNIDQLEHLFSFKARVIEIIDFGNTPIGRRSDVYFDGDLTGGILSGRMRGIDYLLTRSDGISEINVKAVIVTIDGANISVQISGYYHDKLIKDNQIKLLTGNEKYQWLDKKIIVGKGKVTTEGLEIDYFYEP